MLIFLILSKCHIWGGYGGGEGVDSPIEGYARMRGSPFIVNNFSCQLSWFLFGNVNFNWYLCSVTFLIGGDRVDSSLPYIFI